MKPLSGALILSWALVPLAFAQSGPSLSAGWVMEHHFPNGPSGLVATRTAAGDITGDLRADVCIVADGKAYLAFGPDDYATIELIPESITGTSVVDVDYLPRSGPGAFLIVAQGGLHVVSFNAANLTFVSEPTESTNGWGTVQSVRVLNYGGTSTADVVGVDAAHTSVLRIKDFDTTRTYEAPIAVASAIQDIEVLDWTGDGDQEVAVQLASAVRVYDLRTLISEVVAANAVALIQPIRCGGAGIADRLAFVQWESGFVNQTLHVVGLSGAHTSCFLGAVDITASSAGDTDSDGDADLILVNRTTYVMPYLINRYELDPAQLFITTDPNYAQVYQAATETATDNRAKPLLRDFDLDGDADLVVVIGIDRSLLVQRNAHTAEGDYHVTIGTDQWDTSLYPSEQSPQTLRLRVVSPTTSIPGFNRIELDVWRQPYLNAPVELHPDQLSFPITPGFRDLDLNVDLDEDEVPFDALYYISMRQVQVNGANQVVAAGPTLFYLYTTRADHFEDVALDLPPYFPKWPGPEYFPSREAYSGGSTPMPTPPPPAGGTGGGGP